MIFWLDKDESRRVRQIAYVMFEHHMGYYLTRLRMRKRLSFDKCMDTERFKKKDLTPEIMRKVIEDLGGSFIKLGQLLSLRPDLIPQDYCDELSKLQDTVKPFPGDEAVKIIESELKKPLNKLFLEFDKEPIAAASMGQVHVGKLKDGTKVAVKVQRPDVKRTVKIDIKLLYRLAAIIKKKYGSKMMDPIEIVHEFDRYTESELNYMKEAHNIDMFHGNFSKSQEIIIPKVYWSHTTSKVLTMEYIPGKRLSDMSKFKPEQKKKILNTILDSELEQLYVYGLFHADPHPGNFLIKKNGKVALLDFGIVGRIDFVLKEHLTDFFIGLVNKDVESMVNAALKLGIASDMADLEKIRTDIHERMSAYYGHSIEKVRLSDAFKDIIEIFKENNMKISPNFVLLTKATITIESLALNMNPKLVFVEHAKPFVKKLIRERMHPKNIARRARRKIETMMEFASTIPSKTSGFLTEMHSTNRDLKRIDRDISELTVEIDRSSNRLTLGFLAGTLFIASTLILPYQTFKMFGMPFLSFIGYVLALSITISIFISILREKRI
ncbi:MAG: AarF/ABC1/UbiB kinase family protein [Candidatus Woesearchaeota archaeon]